MLPRLRATVLLRCTLFNFGGAFFISNRFFCQATVAASHPPLRLDLFRRGARNLLRFRLPCQPASSTLLFRPPALSPSRLPLSGGGGFYHRRVGCQLRSLTSYFVFHFFSAGASVASATSPFRPTGRGFYHRRVRSQPPSSTLASRSLKPVAVVLGASLSGLGFYHRHVESQLRPAHSVFRPEPSSWSSAAVATSPGRGGAASTTAASGVNTLLQLHLPAGPTLTEQLGARGTHRFQSNLQL